MNREDLRQKLREKIRTKRDSTSSIPEQFRKDPQTTLLQMGVDDADALRLAQSASKRPELFMRQLKQAMHRSDEAPPPPPFVPPAVDDDEAPPPHYGNSRV